jgi:arylsulfatase
MAIGGTTFKVHLDGYNQLPYLTGQQPRARARSSSTSTTTARSSPAYENWKAVFEEQRATGTLRIWAEPFTPLRSPKSSTCVPIRTSAPTSRRTRTTTG